jgi:16S rRNA (guanine1207-N2)-methyltransferase
MTPDRWTLARDTGALLPVEGRCLALMARGRRSLARSVREVLAVQGFRPDHDRLATRGFDVVPMLEDHSGFDAPLVQIVKAKVRTLSAVAEAMGAVVPGGLILIDGAKEEGIEAVLKALRPHVEIDGVFSKAHGKLIWFRRPETVPEAIADWIALPDGRPRKAMSPRPAAFRPTRRTAAPRSSWRWCRRSRGALPTLGRAGATSAVKSSPSRRRSPIST